MRQKESEFYQLLRRNVPGFWSRIENVAGVGIPDCLRVYDGICGPVELKCSIGNYTFFKVSQLAWFAEYHKQGKEVAIVIRDDNLVMVVRSPRLMQLERLPSRDKEVKVLTANLIDAAEYTTTKPFHWAIVQAKIEEIHRVSEKNKS